MKNLHDPSDCGNAEDPKYANIEEPEMAEWPRMLRLRKILGNDVLMLHWPLGSKGTKKRWKHLGAAAMADPKHLAELESGNIGIALGEVSNWLCSIDLDTDEWMTRFLEVNPSLAASLRTRGARGCNIWVRLTGGYRKTFKIKADAGSDIGEWRASGSQTIISGTHPSGCQYSFLVKAAPVEIDFNDIIWPKGIRAPKADSGKLLEPTIAATTLHSNTETQLPSYPATQVVGGVAFGDFLQFVPNGRHQSDRHLWAMAGRLLTWQKTQGRQVTEKEKFKIFIQWYKLARPHLDPAHDQEIYQTKWINAYSKRRQADDETALETAWKAAQQQSLPPPALAEYDAPLLPKSQMLVALCWHLSGEGREQFFLSCRDAGKLLGISHMTANSLMNALSNPNGPYRILKCISIGTLKGSKASEYKFHSRDTTSRVS